MSARIATTDPPPRRRCRRTRLYRQSQHSRAQRLAAGGAGLQRDDASGRLRRRRHDWLISRHQQFRGGGRERARSSRGAAIARHRRTSGVFHRRSGLGLVQTRPRHRHLRQGRDPRRHDAARRRLGRQQRRAEQYESGTHRSRLHLYRLGTADHVHDAELQRLQRHRIGVFQPLDAEGSAMYTRHSSPQIQGGANYAWGDPKSDDLSGKVWVGGVSAESFGEQ